MTDMHIVVCGNPVDGLTFHGPFFDNDEASDWAGNNSDEWWIARLETAIQPGDGTHLEALLGRGDVALLITEAAGLLDSPADVDPDAPVAEYVRGMSELISRYIGFSDNEEYRIAIRDKIRSAL